MNRIKRSPNLQSIASTLALAWLAVLTPFVIAPVVLADENSQDDRASTTDRDAIEKRPSALSVAPLEHIEYPSSRPDWVSAKPSFTDRGTDRIVVVAGPNETREECADELRWMARAAISTYVLGLVPEAENADFFTGVDSGGDQELDQSLVARNYVGKVTAGGEERYEHAIELGFTPESKAKIHQAWKAVELRNRLGAMGAMVGFGLTALICSGGLLGVASRRVSRREQAELA